MLLNLESGAYAFTADPDEGTVTIGRENDCNFIVKEEGVSRHHCKLWFENDRWMVEDSESRWGTQVNNKQVQKPTALKNGDVLRLSSVNFMVSLHRTNDHGAIGKQLAGGGAREKLKMLDDHNKAAAAKPTRTFKAPGKDSNKRLKAALKNIDDEPKVTEEEGVTVIDDSTSDAPDTSAEVDPAAETGTSVESSEVEASEEAPDEKPAKPDKKGSKLRIPAKGGMAAKSARPTKGTRAPKEKDESKKGSPLVKIIIAVVVLAGGGAAAYFATDGFGANAKPVAEEKKDSTEKKEDASTKEAPTGPVIPPKTTEEPKKDETPATENSSNNDTGTKQ